MAALRASARAQGADPSDDGPVRVFGATVFPGSEDRVVVSLDEAVNARSGEITSRGQAA